MQVDIIYVRCYPFSWCLIRKYFSRKKDTSWLYMGIWVLVAWSWLTVLHALAISQNGFPVERSADVELPSSLPLLDIAANLITNAVKKSMGLQTSFIAVDTKESSVDDLTKGVSFLKPRGIFQINSSRFCSGWSSKAAYPLWQGMSDHFVLWPRATDHVLLSL